MLQSNQTTYICMRILIKIIRIMNKSIILLLSFILAGTYVLSQPIWVPFGSSNQKEPNVQLITSTKFEVSFEVEFFGMNVNTFQRGSEQFQRITIPGAQALGLIGSPELISYSKLLAIPECGPLSVQVLVLDSVVYGNYNIYPVPITEQIDSASMLIDREYFTYDSLAYSTNAFSPSSQFNATLSGYLREQKLATAEITPLKYNPYSDSLIVYKKLRITVQFEDPNTDCNAELGYFGNLAHNSILNYNLNNRPASSASPAATGSVTWITNLSPTTPIPFDYLIICDNRFYTPNSNPDQNLSRFAQYRSSHNNFAVGVVNLGQITALTGFPSYVDTDVKKIRYFLRKVFEQKSAPNTFDGHLAYVLLVGDTYRKTGSTMTPMIPASQDLNPGAEVANEAYPNDYYYSCITPITASQPNVYDNSGDLFIGRFSVDNTIQLNNIVEKTIASENEFIPNQPINNFVNSNIYNINPPPTLNNKDRYFMELEQYIISLYTQPINTIPSLEVYSGNACQSQVTTIVNNGVQTMFLYGHSTRGTLLHCDSSIFKTSLNNYAQYPFCISHSCESGWYDNKVIAVNDCFAEFITNYSDVCGFSGYIGASRIIPFYQPDNSILSSNYFIEFLADAIYKNLSTIAGEAIMEAKLRTAYQAINNTDPGICLKNAQTLFGMNYFGDPALNIFPERHYITKSTALPTETIISTPVFVTNNASLIIPANGILRFTGNGKLTIEAGATLEIGNNAFIQGSSANNSIISYGIVKGPSGNEINGAVFTHFHPDGSSRWGGVSISNQDLEINFKACHMSYASFEFNCHKTTFNDLQTNPPISFDTCALIHAKGTTTLKVNNCRFLNCQILCDNPVFANSTYPLADIRNCIFNNTLPVDYVVRLHQYPRYYIGFNTINHVGGLGIDLQYIISSAYENERNIESNTILKNGNLNNNDGSTALNMYSFKGVVKTKNQFKFNDFGLMVMRNSNVRVEGITATSTANAQQFANNYKNQIKVLGSTWLTNVYHNRFENTVSAFPWIYHCQDCALQAPPIDGIIRPIENNSWGTANVGSVLTPVGGYDYTPTWNLPNLKSGNIALGNDMQLYNLAMDTAQKGFCTVAENLLDSLLKSYPDSNISITAVRDYLSIEEGGLRNFERIKQKYTSNPIFQQNEKLGRAALFMVKESNLRMGNYTEAIAWLESEIAVPYSFADSVCALIDLGHAYALMANAGYKLSPAKAPNGQDLPLTSEQYYGWYNYHLKNFNQVQANAQVLPCDTCGAFMGCAAIRFHPNPVSDGQVVIEFMQPTNQMLSISLSNQLGQIVLQRTGIKATLNKRITIRLPECKKGVHFLRVQSTEINCTYKLIIN